MKINKQDLQTALEIVKPGLANKEIIEQSSSFAFLENKIATYNDEISVSYPIKGIELQGAVRAEELYELLRKIDSEEIDVEINGDELLFKAGKLKAGLVFQSEIHLPLDEVNEEKNWKELPEEFTHDLMFVKDSCSRDMSQRVLTCVHATDSFLQASDGFQIMKLTQAGWPLDDYLIPAEHISEIHKVEPTHVAETSGWLHFKNPNGTEISARILVDSFPNTDDFFGVKGEKIIFPKEMSKILERAMVFSKREQSVDEVIDIKLKGGKALIHGENNYGWFEEKTVVKHKGDEISFSISPALLKNILSRSNKCIVGDEKLQFVGKDWDYVAALKST